MWPRARAGSSTATAATASATTRLRRRCRPIRVRIALPSDAASALSWAANVTRSAREDPRIARCVSMSATSAICSSRSARPASPSCRSAMPHVPQEDFADAAGAVTVRGAYAVALLRLRDDQGAGAPGDVAKVSARTSRIRMPVASTSSASGRYRSCRRPGRRGSRRGGGRPSRGARQGAVSFPHVGRGARPGSSGRRAAGPGALQRSVPRPTIGAAARCALRAYG